MTETRPGDPQGQPGFVRDDDPGGGDPLFDSIPDAVVAVDAGGRIALANARMGELFGYAREEMLGAPIWQLVPGGLGGGSGGPGMTAALDVPALRKDGSEFSAEGSRAASRPARG